MSTSHVKCGDAYDLVSLLPEASIDLIITSPPYWGQRTYGLDHNEDTLPMWLSSGQPGTIPPYAWYREHGGLLGMEPLPGWYTAHLTEIFSRAAQALKPEGSLWVNIGDTYYARWSSIRERGQQGLNDNPRTRRKAPSGGYRQEKQLLLVPARFAIAMQDDRWILRNDLIWSKPHAGPWPGKDRLQLTHEHFFHFVKRPREGRARYYYDLTQTEPGSRDVVTVPTQAGSSGHSATFPVKLIQPRILSSCPQGGTVLDPFCGTGRALVVAVKSGRSAIGFDLKGSFTDAALASLGDEGVAA